MSRRERSSILYRQTGNLALSIKESNTIYERGEEPRDAHSLNIREFAHSIKRNRTHARAHWTCTPHTHNVVTNMHFYWAVYMNRYNITTKELYVLCSEGSWSHHWISHTFRGRGVSLRVIERLSKSATAIWNRTPRRFTHERENEEAADASRADLIRLNPIRSRLQHTYALGHAIS